MTTDFRHLGTRVSDVTELGVEESDEDVFEEVRKSVLLPWKEAQGDDDAFQDICDGQTIVYCGEIFVS